MNRIWFVVAGVAVIAIFSGQRFCGKQPVLSLPSSAGNWTLTVPQNCLKPVPPEWKRWRGLDGAQAVCSGEYAGSPPMKLTLYDFPSEYGSAFDAAQKWTPQPGKMSFFKGRYFGVVESPGAGHFAIEPFVLAVEATLPGAGEWHH